ncbi:tail fiber domain-containing protein [Gluconobacter cerinus]|uniref:tail fiber domain-containing protein n=1 Tax=Gluconobacter cerinus TaxID=38307 RepID=UPI001B8AE428|nr:tail fiber domain-containing protein [Gluconobacter cerinus]MBS1034979.1 tail fiber domain-containing protein [Gluconobacter cerinus]
MSLANGNPVFASVGGDASKATVTYTATGATVATTMALSAMGVLLASTADTSSSAATVANEAKAAVSGFNDALSKCVTADQASVAGGYVAYDAGGGVNIPSLVGPDAYLTIGTMGAGYSHLVMNNNVGNPHFISWGDTGAQKNYIAVGASSFLPDGDGSASLGISGNAWSGLVTQTSPQVVSDINDKTIIGTLGDSAYADVTTKLRAVWADISGVVFTLNAGQSNRQHIGVIAQTVQAAFQKQGLDAAEFGVWCSDPKTKAVQAVVGGKTVTTIEPVYEADGTTQATQQTIRYEELLSLGLFCERLDHADLVTRVAALEAKASTAAA